MREVIKDIAEKKFIANNDVFAEIFNEFVLKGTGLVIHEDELEDARVRSVYVPVSEDDSIREQERDVAKFWRKGGLILSLLGLEGQSAIDKYMPVRVIGYEGADYRYQVIQREEAIGSARHDGNKELAAELRGRKFYPVITAVLYYGTTRRWKKYKSLYECLDIPEGLKGIVEDRHINVIELAWLSEEQQNALKTDMNIFVDALRQIRLTGTYKPNDSRYVKHVEDILVLLRALSGYRDEYTEALFRYGANREKGEPATMLDIIGAAQKYYFREGRAEVIREYADMMKRAGFPDELIEKFKALRPEEKIDDK